MRGSYDALQYVSASALMHVVCVWTVELPYTPGTQLLVPCQLHIQLCLGSITAITLFPFNDNPTKKEGEKADETSGHQKKKKMKEQEQTDLSWSLQEQEYTLNK